MGNFAHILDRCSIVENMLLTFLLVLITLTDQLSVSNARTIPSAPTKHINNTQLNDLLALDAEIPNTSLDRNHQISKRDTLDTIISLIELIPGVPKLPYRQILKLLNPLRIKIGGDVKGSVKFNNGSLDITSVIAARAGILNLMAGIALGSKGSIGKKGIGLSVGGTMGYGTKNLPNGEIANGDTNVPYQKYNSNMITA